MKVFSPLFTSLSKLTNTALNSREYFSALPSNLISGGVSQEEAWKMVTLNPELSYTYIIMLLLK